MRAEKNVKYSCQVFTSLGCCNSGPLRRRSVPQPLHSRTTSNLYGHTMLKRCWQASNRPFRSNTFWRSMASDTRPIFFGPFEVTTQVRRPLPASSTRHPPHRPPRRQHHTEPLLTTPARSFSRHLSPSPSSTSSRCCRATCSCAPAHRTAA